MKIVRKISSLLVSGALACSMLAAANITACAESAEEHSYNLDVTIDFKKEAELPLTMDRSTEVFYFNGNINPGDKMYADIIVKNTSDKTLQYTLSEVKNMLEDDEQAKLLLNVLNLKITQKDKVMYDGKCSEITTPVIPWFTLESGKTDTINVEYEFDKWADNTYQGANMRQKWIFQTRADIPPDESEPDSQGEPDTHKVTVSTPDSQHEDVKTGVTEEKSNYTFIIIGVGVAVAGAYVIYEVIRRKKSNKDKD